MMSIDPRKLRDPRLHLGCDPLTLDGWINIDHKPCAGVDLLWELANDIPITDARFAQVIADYRRDLSAT
jgi:hypothetical protein